MVPSSPQTDREHVTENAGTPENAPTPLLPGLEPNKGPAWLQQDLGYQRHDPASDMTALL